MRAAPASNFVIFAPNLLVAIASRLPLVLFRLRLPKANQALVARSGVSNELGMEQPEVPGHVREVRRRHVPALRSMRSGVDGFCLASTPNPPFPPLGARVRALRAIWSWRGAAPLHEGADRAHRTALPHWHQKQSRLARPSSSTLCPLVPHISAARCRMILLRHLCAAPTAPPYRRGIIDEGAPRSDLAAY